MSAFAVAIGYKRTWPFALHMSANDPKRTSTPACSARQMLSELKELDGSGIEYYVLPPLCPLVGSPYDFSQADTLIERAIKSTDAWIADGGLEKANVHTQLSIHKHGHQKSIRSN